MGIQSLCTFLNKTCSNNRTIEDAGVRTINLNTYRGKKIGIDTSNIIHKHLGNEEHMVKMISKICYKLLKTGIYPLFVFDSRIKKNKTNPEVPNLMNEERKKHEEEYKQMMQQLSDDKKKTVSKRYNLRKKNKNYSILYNKIYELRSSNSDLQKDYFEEMVKNFVQEINDSTEEETQKIKEEDINVNYYFNCQIDEIIEKKEVSERLSTTIVSNDIYYFKALLDFYGISYVEAYGEADGMLAQLCNEGVIDAVISDDSDLLAFGCNRLLRNFDVHKDEVLEYRFEYILDNLNLSYSEFLDMCILMGTDFNERLRKTPEIIYSLIQENHNFESVIEKIPKLPSIFLSLCEKTRNIFYTRTPSYYIEYTRGIMNLTDNDENELSKIIYLTFMNIKKIVKMQKESKLTNFVDYLNYEISSSSDDSESEHEDIVKRRQRIFEQNQIKRMRKLKLNEKNSLYSNNFGILFNEE